MIELNQTEFANILPLLVGSKQQVLPYAICQGMNPGRVFVDCREIPQVALIWSPVGYYFLFGEPAQTMDLSAIGRVLTEIFIPASQAAGESGLILIPSTGVWKGYLPVLLPNREVIEIYRRPFTFSALQFAPQRTIPQGFRLQAVDAALAERLGVLASWTTVEDFLANGVGFALLAGDEVAGACSSVFASHEKVEIDVHTAEKYRRRGFAMLTASALIEACLQRGKQPNWECFWDNEPSNTLAGKLGFKPLPDYPVYYWEEL